MNEPEYIIRNIDSLTPVPTAHQVGHKAILLGNDLPHSPITQIAHTTLQAGECTDYHAHPTMDEHFYILQGRAIIAIDGTRQECNSNTYILIRAGIDHSIEAVTNVELLTIGIAK